MITNQFKIAFKFTLITTILFGLVYPLLMTAYAHVVNREQAEGQLIHVDGKVVGSRIIGQGFTGARYFHGRPSAAGNGYDATASGGSNFGLSSQKLIARIDADVKTASMDQPGTLVPAELVEASGSGLDPEISPAAAYYQVERVATARHLSADTIRKVVESSIEGRQFKLLGEPRVNVLMLNLKLDQQN